MSSATMEKTAMASILVSSLKNSRTSSRKVSWAGWAICATGLSLGSAAAQETGRQLLTSITSSNIHEAVDAWVLNSASATATYGDISGWDTSAVTVMNQLFGSANTFNQDIGSWDTSAVTNFRMMFYLAYAFDQDISGWETGEASFMYAVFFFASAFNQNIGGWDTTKVTDLSTMFYKAYAFNQDISSWNTGAATTIQTMFAYTTVFNKDISEWDTGAVTSMTNIFVESAFNQNIGGWDTAKTLGFVQAFMDNTAFNQDISGWDTGSIIHIKYMFSGASSFNQDVSGWNTASVTSFEYTFSGALAFNQALCWDTSGISTTSMFTGSSGSINLNAAKCACITGEFYDGSKCQSCPAGQDSNGKTESCFYIPSPTLQPTFLLTSLTASNINTAVAEWLSDSASATSTYGDISEWDMSAVTTLEDTFREASTFNQNISTWDIGAVTSLYRTFLDATAFNQNIGRWNTCNVRTLYQTFYRTYAFNQDIGRWDIGLATNMAAMFYSAVAFNQDIGKWDTGAVTSLQFVFFNAVNFDQDIGDWNTASMTSLASTFYGASAFNQNVGGWDTGAVTDLQTTFYRATAFNQDIGGWEMRVATNLRATFCYATNFDQNIGGWDTGMVVDMAYTFSASAFNHYIGGWNTTKAIDFTGMFLNATAFNQDVKEWDMKVANSLAYTFCGASNFNQDISGWNIGRVSTMAHMFRLSAFNQDISAWCTGAVTSMVHMFRSSAFNQDISGWDTRVVTNMAQMFRSSPFNQDIGEWSTNAVVSLSYTFGESIFNQDISKWNTSRVTNLDRIFCSASTFNQDIGGWNTGLVTSLKGAFSDASVFNQDVSAWDVRSVTSIAFAFVGATAFNQVLCWDAIGKNTTSMFDESSGSLNPNAAKCACKVGEFYDGTTCQPCLAAQDSYGKTESCFYLYPVPAPTTGPSLSPTSTSTFGLPQQYNFHYYVNMVAASTGFVWIAFALVISCVVLAKKHLIYSYYLKARYGSSALSQSLKSSDGHREGTSTQYMNESTHAMFQSLDVNNDGYICAQDLGCWLKQEIAKANDFKARGHRNLDAASYDLHLEEVSAFQLASSTEGSTSGSNLERKSFELEGSTLVDGDKSDMLSEEGLAKCLALFPMLAFDWVSPISYDNSNLGSFFIRVDAAALFRRLDSNNDGWVTVEDLRAWRQSLPLGRSEDDLVRSFFTRCAKSGSVYTGKASAISTTPWRSPTSAHTKTLHHGSEAAAILANDSQELRLWDFYVVLQDDPMLAAELCTQAIVLDFRAGDGHKDDKKSSRFKPFVKGNGTKWKVLPSENTIKACVCLAKLQLCRLASAYCVVYAHEEEIAAFVLCALDATGHGTVGALDFQNYLQEYANMKSLSVSDVQCLLDDNALHRERINRDGTMTSQLSAATSSSTKIKGYNATEQVLNRKTLRQLLSRPAHRKFAGLLCQFVQVQQERANKGYVANILHARLPSQKRMTMREQMAAHHAAELERDHDLKKGVHSAGGVSARGYGRKSGESGITAAAASNRAAFTSMFDDQTKHRIPPGFDRKTLNNWFKQLDKDRDGYVTPRDLVAWCTSASCQDLVDEVDLESLFHPSLPNFSISSGHDLPQNVAREAYTSAALHVVVDDDEEFISDGPKNVGTSSLTESTKAADSQDKVNKIMSLLRQNANAAADKAHASLIRAAQLASLPAICGLHKRALSAALARRPLLAARFALMHRFSCAVQPVLLVEARAKTAITVATSAEAAVAAAIATATTPSRKGTETTAKTATATARQAAARTKSEWIKMSCKHNNEIDKSSSEKNAAIVQELEAQIKEAEASDPRSAAAHAARYALQDHFLVGARQKHTLMSIEVALEVKLLAWREAKDCPTQLQQLHTLLPLSPKPSPHVAAVTAKTARKTETKVKGINGKTPAQRLSTWDIQTGISGRSNQMASSLDNDNEQGEYGEGTGSTIPASAKMKRSDEHELPTWSSQGIARGSSLDQDMPMTTSRFERRLSAARNNAGAKRGLPAPRPQPRQRLQRTQKSFTSPTTEAEKSRLPYENPADSSPEIWRKKSLTSKSKVTPTFNEAEKGTPVTVTSYEKSIAL